VAEAVQEAGRASRVTLVGHDLAGRMPQLLRDRVAAAAICQDPAEQLRRAIRTAAGGPVRQVDLLAPIEVFLAENLPAER
jgi:ABC-type sugar transport system substrate-binding protein